MSEPIEPGTIVAGKFRVDRVLGQGGVGVVVLAQHLKLDEPVAIKFLLPEALANRAMVTRFEREARAAVKIKSEHSVRVIDVGSLDSGAPYIVMEYLRGSDLRSVLQQRGPLPLEEAAEYLLQACEALAEAHALGIIHRDLKPANLFLARRPDGSACVKVLDFGVSKVTGDAVPGAGQGVTTTHTVMGSPRYMSPEQLVSTRDVDVRTDIWALGVTLFELTTGSAPFDGNSVSELAGAIMTAEPVKIRSLRRELPVNLERLLLACLEKKREKRVASVADFAKRLGEFAPKTALASLDRIARLSQAPSQPPIAPEPPAISGTEPTAALTLTEFSQTGTRSATGKRWLAGAGTLLAAGTAIFVLVRVVSSAPPAGETASSSPPSAPMLEAPATVKPVPPESDPLATPPPVAASASAAPAPSPAQSATGRAVSPTPVTRRPAPKNEAPSRPSPSTRVESAPPPASSARPRDALGGRL